METICCMARFRFIISAAGQLGIFCFTHAIEEWKCKFIEMIDRRRVLSYLPWFWVDNCFPFAVPVCSLNHCTVLLLHIWCIVCLIHRFSFYNALLYFCRYSNYQLFYSECPNRYDQSFDNIYISISIQNRKWNFWSFLIRLAIDIIAFVNLLFGLMDLDLLRRRS